MWGWWETYIMFLFFRQKRREKQLKKIIDKITRLEKALESYQSQQEIYERALDVHSRELNELSLRMKGETGRIALRILNEEVKRRENYILELTSLVRISRACWADAQAALTKARAKYKKLGGAA